MALVDAWGRLAIVGHVAQQIWSKALKAIVFAVYLTPSLPLISGVPAMRAEEIVLFLLFLWLFVRLTSGKKTAFITGSRQTLLVLFSVFVLLSMLVGSFLGFQATYGDFAQLIRIGKYVGIYTVALNAIHLAEDPMQERNAIRRAILIGGCALTLITLQQYFDWFGLNELYVQFVAPTQYESVITSVLAPRPVGMVGNPNELGFLLATAVAVAVYEFITEESPRKIILGIAGFLMIGVILTQSRSAMVYAVVTVGSLIGLTFSQRRGLDFSRLARFMLPIILLAVGMLVAFTNTEIYSRVGWRFLEGMDLNSSLSSSQRVTKIP
jgi:hypothetical protein